MEDKIVYFACNDWNPSPDESYNICYNYLGSYTSVDRDKVVNKTIEEVWDFVENNKMCINCDIVDMSCSYYITAPKKVFETYFKELLPFIKSEPYDFLFKGDKKIFLEHNEKNIGFNYFDPKNNGKHK